MLLIAMGVAAWKVKDAAAWKSAAEAERSERLALMDGVTIRDKRIVSTNEWAKQIEARYNEREQVITVLQERVDAQQAHISKLLERTPEKLWEAVERHSAAAEEHWNRTQEFQHEAVQRLDAKLDRILEGVERIDGG